MGQSRFEKESLKRIFVKNRFLDLIVSGQKTAEARPTSEIENIGPGEQIIFSSSLRQITVRAKSIETYEDITGLVDKADLNSLLPGINKAQAMQEWKKLYPNYSGKICVLNFELENH